MNWLLVRTVCMNVESYGPHSFSDLDFAADVVLLLAPALENMASEAASLRLKVNRQKTKVQALCSREDESSTTTGGCSG